MPVADMIDHLVGMQAQNPLDPYYALWARLENFDPSDLATMTRDHEVVRGQFMRGTIHLFTADDALAVHPVTRSVLEKVFRSTQFSKDIDGVDTDALLGAARSMLEERPHTRAELAKELGSRWLEYPPASLAQAATYLIPVTQVPPRGVWGEKGPAAWTTIETFLGREYGDGLPVDELAIRYLRAFGPASVKDMRNWSGLTGLREVFDRLRPRLRTYRDENGTELFDLPDIDLPDPETPAPVRLLPEYDNVLLGHDDRSRFFPDDAAPAGWVGTVLVDGQFAGDWKVNGQTLELSVVDRAAHEEEALHEEVERLIRLASLDVEEVRLSVV